jgi:hypothetical protein
MKNQHMLKTGCFQAHALKLDKINLTTLPQILKTSKKWCSTASLLPKSGIFDCFSHRQAKNQSSLTSFELKNIMVLLLLDFCIVE